MLKTLVLFLHLANGQIAVIPGFLTRGDCEQTGQWYKQNSNGRATDYWCGPGPTTEADAAPILPQFFPPR